jgi:hypothetical protein
MQREMLDGKNTINIMLVILQAANERADDDDGNKKQPQRLPATQCIMLYLTILN